MSDIILAILLIVMVYVLYVVYVVLGFKVYIQLLGDANDEDATYNGNVIASIIIVSFWPIFLTVKIIKNIKKRK